MKEANFTCNHCGHKFVLEDRLLRHHCKQMKRKEELESPTGQAAWQHYQTWMKCNHRLVPEIKSFLHSKFFNAFIRFAKFVKEVRIPDPELYIRFMIELDNPPVLFTSDQIYSAFLQHMDRKVSAAKNAQITTDTLFNIAEDAGVDVSKVFDIIDPNDLIQLLRQRRVSPWLLLHSDKFKKFYASNLTEDQRIVMKRLIRPEYWAVKLKEKPENVDLMKQMVGELGI
jgi:hypothetical protein